MTHVNMKGYHSLSQRVKSLYNQQGGWYEGLRLEFKEAQGGLPSKELWRSYSAFANTDGGIILLGVSDAGKILGVPNITRRHKELVDVLNNPQKISYNLCAEPGRIECIKFGDKEIIAIDVPRADPKHQPIHLNGDEKYSYVRQQEADVQCSQEDIMRMRRNKEVSVLNATLDDYIIPNSTLDDINMETLNKFRNFMRGTPMGNLWQHDDDESLLRHLQAYRTDRATKMEGVTLAGLIMFGKHDSIIELWPRFQLDYFDYESTSDSNARWADRLTNDGSWAGNLYEFFFRVLSKLQAGLKRPFELNENMTRKDETAAHIAFREALANAIVHADYWEDAGIRIIKDVDGIRFINPGTMLVNKDTLFSEEETISVCRNKCLQRMFQTLGIVDKAGSGVEKIAKGWFESCLAMPEIGELDSPHRVVWRLPYVGMISKEKISDIVNLIGEKSYTALSSFEKLVLVSIPFNGYVSHKDIMGLLPMHTADLSRYLAKFVSRGYLKTQGHTRAMRYCIDMNYHLIEMSQLGGEMSQLDKEINGEMSQLGGEMSQLDGRGEKEHNTQDINKKGYFVRSDEMSQLDGEMSQLDKEINGEMSQLSGEMSQLPERVRMVRDAKRVTEEYMERAICDLCANGWITSVYMAEVLKRDKRTLLRILRPMVNHGLLVARYPSRLTHPQQAYKTKQ